MGIFKTLGNALSGNTAHWTTTHNPLVTDLWERANALPGNGPAIFKNYIIYSGFAVEMLVFPQKGNPLLNVDVKSITRCQFHNLYTVLLAFLVAKTSCVEPTIKQDIKDNLYKVVGPDRTALANQFIEDIGAVPEAMFESVRLWKAVTSALNSKDMDIQSQLILHSVLVNALATGA